MVLTKMSNILVEQMFWFVHMNLIFVYKKEQYK